MLIAGQIESGDAIKGVNQLAGSLGNSLELVCGSVPKIVQERARGRSLDAFEDSVELAWPLKSHEIADFRDTVDA